MDNIFRQNGKREPFSWQALGNIKEGRGDLGEYMPVLVYRLMQYTVLDVLQGEFGLERANDIIRRAGQLAGREFARNVLDLAVSAQVFVSNLQVALADFKIGILRLEKYDEQTGEIVLTIGQDLDCSGIPVSGNNVCDYDEGFLSGILSCYTGKSYNVKEIDCWATGNRVCRFRGVVEQIE